MTSERIFKDIHLPGGLNITANPSNAGSSIRDDLNEIYNRVLHDFDVDHIYPTFKNLRFVAKSVSKETSQPELELDDIRGATGNTENMSSPTDYRHELSLRDDQLRREIDLREKSFRSEQGVRDQALDERLGRIEGSVSGAVKEIKDFKLWMAGIGIAVVLAIMGANYTLIGSAQGIFDGGKASLESQQKIEKLIEESRAQALQNRQLLESIQAKQPSPPTK